MKRISGYIFLTFLSFSPRSKHIHIFTAVTLWTGHPALCCDESESLVRTSRAMAADVCDVQVGQLGYWDQIHPDQLVTGIPS